MKRIILFVLTNLAVVLVLSATLSILGVNRFMTQQGLNVQMLLVFSVIVGFTAGAAILIINSQLGTLLGASVPRGKNVVDTIGTVIGAFQNNQWQID